MNCSQRCTLLFGASLSLFACSTEPNEVDVKFSLQHQGKDVGCGDTLKDLGLTETEAQLRDARLYIHDIRVVLDDDQEVSLALIPSTFQRDGVALLDFADDTGICATGSPETNQNLLGEYESDGNVVALRFKIGLPPELNHLDAARAAAPLNAPGMAWSWTGGYKYARIDLKTEKNENWYLHLGATGCEGVPGQEIKCAYGNLAEIEVPLGGANGSVTLDLDSLYAKSDLDAPIDYQSDFVNGCMAFGGDPECPPVFDALGIQFESNSTSTQRVFGGTQ